MTAFLGVGLIHRIKILHILGFSKDGCISIGRLKLTKTMNIFANDHVFLIILSADVDFGQVLYCKKIFIYDANINIFAYTMYIKSKLK